MVLFCMFLLSYCIFFGSKIDQSNQFKKKMSVQVLSTDHQGNCLNQQNLKSLTTFFFEHFLKAIINLLDRYFKHI